MKRKENVKDDKQKNIRKAIFPLIVAVSTLLVFVIGATYAYFGVGITGNNIVTTITGSTPKQTVIALQSKSNQLSISLTAEQMSPTVSSSADKKYFADVNGTVSDNSPGPVIAAITITGDTANTYTCTYKYNIKATADGIISTYKNHYGFGGIRLWLTGMTTGSWDITEQKYVTALLGTGLEITGSMTIGGSTKTRNLQITFRIDNLKDKDQTFMAGKSETLTITTTLTSCTLQTS